MHFLIYVNSASTADHSTLLPYSLRVGFERFTGKISDLYLISDKRLVEVAIVQ